MSIVLIYGLALLGGAVIGGVTDYFGACAGGGCPLTSTWWRGAIYGAVLGFLLAMGMGGGRT